MNYPDKHEFEAKEPGGVTCRFCPYAEGAQVHQIKQEISFDDDPSLVFPADQPSPREREEYKRPAVDHVDNFGGLADEELAGQAGFYDDRTPRERGEEPEEVSGTEVSTWVDKAMFSSEEFNPETISAPKVYLLSATPDPLGAVAAFAMMYEGRVIRDLSEITDDERRSYFNDCFNTALRTPLEAIDLHFMVEGLTRASWDQMVRQRTAVFAGESLRFAVKEDLKQAVRPGPSVRTREQIRVHNEAVDRINDAYLSLIGSGVPAEDARGLLPMNVLTRGHWKTNLRNLEAEVGKRLCTQAQFEWRLIHADLRRAIREHQTWADQGDAITRQQPWERGVRSQAWQWEYIADSNLFKPICFQKGSCMFKASMDRGCTIRARVDDGKFDEIRTEEWAADPTAAWVR